MENFDKKDRQLNNLENLVENHTRTERHLEQYSQIGNTENKQHARKIQNIREEEIKKLENNIKGKTENNQPEVQLQNLKEKYENTQNYIKNNYDNINEQMMQDLKSKQEKRKNQINFLENEE